MTPDFDRREVCRLASQALDGSIADEALARLECLLTSHAEARQLYYQLIAVHGDLAWELGESDGLAQLNHAKQADDARRPAADTNPPVPSLSKAARSLFARRLIGSIGLVAVLTYGAFTLIAWNLRPDSLPNGGHVNNASVALVSDTTNVQWPKNISPKSAKTSIALGEPLNIDSGTIELELKRGAKLTIEGPAKWTIDGDNSATLHSGKLLATVPRAAAGFTVETATARIVDLGTEFSVEADASGASEVQVFKGKVELHPSAKRRSSSLVQQPITLSAGEARRIEPGAAKGSVVVRAVAPKSNRLTRSLAVAPTEVRQIRVEGASASSTYPVPDLDAEYLIRGRGFKGDRHSAKWRGTMWHSALGQVKNEFVLFDLVRPHRLDSMKVWNFNDADRGRYAWIGVKQADIYVSTWGKGDPLSQPADWKLVVADQQFAPGTGKDDYATPTVVPLGDIEGRFVGIVIDDALGHGPHGIDHTPDIVGLSEVQFFGSRIESSKPQPK